MANLAALRAAVFSLSAKNLRGRITAPPAVRGLKRHMEGRFNFGEPIRQLKKTHHRRRSTHATPLLLSRLVCHVSAGDPYAWLTRFVGQFDKGPGTKGPGMSLFPG